MTEIGKAADCRTAREAEAIIVMLCWHPRILRRTDRKRRDVCATRGFLKGRPLHSGDRGGLWEGLMSIAKQARLGSLPRSGLRDKNGQTGLSWRAILNAVAVSMVAGAVPSGQTAQQSLMNFDGVASVALRS